MKHASMVPIGIAALVCALASLHVPSAAAAEYSVRNGYVDYRYGQLHYTQATPVGREAVRGTPLVMIHQTVNSSIESQPLFADLARDRVVLAVDTPGYGGSDGPQDVVTIEEYAAAIAEALRALGYGPARQVDVIGFHTGSLIAAELAIAEPAMVRRAVLSGLYVVPEERWKRALESLPDYRTSAGFYDWFAAMLPRMRTYYEQGGLPDAVWGRIIAESLRPVTKREYGHHAAFLYAGRAAERMPKVTQPVLLLALGDGLGRPTVDSQPLFRNAELVDLPQYKDGAYFPDPAPVAEALRRFLR